MNDESAPLSWWHVLLVILSGLFLAWFFGFWLIWPLYFMVGTLIDYVPQWLMLASLVMLAFGPAVAGAWLALRGRSLDAFPAWGLLSVGYLLIMFWLFPAWGLFPASSPPRPQLLDVIASWAMLLLIPAALVLALWKQRPGRIHAAVWVIVALGVGIFLLQGSVGGGFRYDRLDHNWAGLGLPIAAGILLARRHGPRAALLVLPLGFWLAEFEIEHAIYFPFDPFMGPAAWGALLQFGGPLLLFVVAPLLTLRARTLLGQALGLLLPAGAYYLLLVVLLGYFSWLVETGEGLPGAIVRAEPLVRLLVLLAGLCALYGWLSPGGYRPVAPQTAAPSEAAESSLPESV